MRRRKIEAVDAVDATRSINILTEEESWPQAVFVQAESWHQVFSTLIYPTAGVNGGLQLFVAFGSTRTKASAMAMVALATITGLSINCSRGLSVFLFATSWGWEHVLPTKVSPWQLAPQSTVKINSQ